MLARILGEVGTLCTVLLNVCFRICLLIFTEICSYLRDKAKKISYHIFETLRRYELDTDLVELNIAI